MAHYVICKICGKKFDRDKEPSVLVSSRRYAHASCANGGKPVPPTDREKLENYIKQLFGYESLPLRVTKQIDSYVKQYNYSYSGMLKALVYFYEIKKGDLEKANGGIGIIPYIWEESYNYFYSLWLTNQKNADKKIEKPKVREVRIKSPERKIRRRRFFTFLDREE